MLFALFYPQILHVQSKCEMQICACARSRCTPADLDKESPNWYFTQCSVCEMVTFQDNLQFIYGKSTVF